MACCCLTNHRRFTEPAVRGHEVIELKTNHGFKQFAIIQNEGIVIKHEDGSEQAVQVAYLVLDLASKSKKYIRELFDPPDNDVEVRSLNCSRSQSAFLIQHDNPPLRLSEQSLRLKTANMK